MICSCSTGDDKKRAELLTGALKERYGTESVSILRSGQTADMELTVHFGRELTDVGDVRLIGSTAALLLYNGLGEKEKKDVGSLRVAVETPSSRSDVMDYRTADLKEVAWLLELEDHVFALLKKRDYNAIRALVWPREILPKVDQLFGVYEAICRHDGEITKMELLGFNFVEKTVAATAQGIPVFVAWFAVSHGTAKSEYQISIRTDTRQVIVLSINES